MSFLHLLHWRFFLLLNSKLNWDIWTDREKIFLPGSNSGGSDPLVLATPKTFYWPTQNSETNSAKRALNNRIESKKRNVEFPDVSREGETRRPGDFSCGSERSVATARKFGVLCFASVEPRHDAERIHVSPDTRPIGTQSTV